MDFLNSFFQNIKDKLTSPFFGTLTFVLIIHHWEFWYSLFNFDKDCTRTEKLAILRLIANKEFGNYRIVGDIGLALLIMLIGYLVVMGTRTLSLFIEFRFMPWITGKVINKKVVERSVHEKIVEERDEYSEKYEDQRRAVRNLSKDYDKLMVDIQLKNDRITQQNDDITLLQDKSSQFERDLADERDKNKRLRDDNNNLKLTESTVSSQLESEQKRSSNIEGELGNLLKVLLSQESFSADQRGKVPPSINNYVNKIKESGNWNGFKNYLHFENKGGIVDTANISKMQSLGLAGNGERGRKTALAKVIEAYIPLLD